MKSPSLDLRTSIRSVTLAAYPLVPKSEVGFRIQITAANTRAEIDRLIDVLGEVASRFDLQPARHAEFAA